MSDIVIKGIELPKEGKISISITSDGNAYLGIEPAYSQKKFETVVLPPHGKLISTDVLQRELYKLLYSPQISRMNQDEVVEYIIDDIVDKASTVLGASEVKE